MSWQDRSLRLGKGEVLLKNLQSYCTTPVLKHIMQMAAFALRAGFRSGTIFISHSLN